MEIDKALRKSVRKNMSSPTRKQNNIKVFKTHRVVNILKKYHVTPGIVYRKQHGIVVIKYINNIFFE